MPLEIRPAAAAQSFDLFDGDEKIGEILYVGPPGSIGSDGWKIEEEAWEVGLWNVPGSIEEWGGVEDTADAAKETAYTLYVEFAAKRCEINSPVPGVSVRPVPMGGQPRKR